MSNLSYANRGGAICFVASKMDIANVATKVETNAAIDYSIDGIMYEATTNTGITLTGDTQEKDTECLYLVSVNAAGTFAVTKGEEQLTTDLEKEGKGLHWPDLPAASAAVGAFKIVTVAVVFVPATTALSASGVTDTYYDLATVPSATV